MYIYVHTNCSCGSSSNQLTTAAGKDFVRKLCKKLSDEIFLYSVCSSNEAPLHLMVLWTDTAEFGAVSYLKKLPNTRGTQQRLTCDLAWWHVTSLDLIFSGINCNKPSVPGHGRILHSTTISSKMENPTFWKQCPLAFKPMLSKQLDWKRQFLSMVPKITSGLFNLGLWHENVIYQEKM